jgi:predicted RNA-binding protein with PUA-like domain
MQALEICYTVAMTAYYLMKSEGDCYPISQLKKDKESPWSGVRNYQARNYMKGMKVGDKILFYHSSSKPTGVFGLAEVSKQAMPDISALDIHNEHYDQKSTKEKPIWECVTVAFIEEWKNPVTLDTMKKTESLSNMKLFQKGSRLSIIPVTKKEYDIICKMSESK